jgi:hypothetical protein
VHAALLLCPDNLQYYESTYLSVYPPVTFSINQFFYCKYLAQCIFNWNVWDRQNFLLHHQAIFLLVHISSNQEQSLSLEYATVLSCLYIVGNSFAAGN